MQKKWKVAMMTFISSIFLMREKSTANSQVSQESVIKVFDGYLVFYIFAIKYKLYISIVSTHATSSSS